MSSLSNTLRAAWNSIVGADRTNRRRRAKALAAGDQLESRRLLATLVSTTKITYQDIDGDNVSVTFSKPILTNATVANSVFSFDTGSVSGSNAGRQQLRSINLSAILAAAGTTITTAAVRSATTGGDGFAAVGQIDATGRDISTVTIDGDLGRIVAGDAVTTTQGLGALTAHSIGRFGTFTGAVDLVSRVSGSMLSLKTKSDIKDAVLLVDGGINGTIGSITIGGSLIGGLAESSGLIAATSNIGAVSITGDIRGGDGDGSGVLLTEGKIASVTMGGSLAGGIGNSSGAVFSTSDLGAVIINGDLLGGVGFGSGRVRSQSGKIASVTIAGSITGDSGLESGSIVSRSDLGLISVKGDVRGAIGEKSGFINSETGRIAGVSIGGSLFGSIGLNSGTILSKLAMGAVNIKGDVLGAEGENSGKIQSTDSTIASVTIGGSLLGGSGTATGVVAARSDIGPVIVTGNMFGNADGSGRIVSGFGNVGLVTIGGSMVGGGGALSGTITTEVGSIAGVTIGGSLIGGTFFKSGNIESALNMGAVNIKGDLRGGNNLLAGAVQAGGKLTSVTIGGSLVGGSGNGSGLVSSGGDMGAVTVQRNVIGGAGPASGRIRSDRGKVASVTIGGSLVGGFGEQSGSVSSLLDMGPVNIKGDVRGGTANFSGAIMTDGTNTAAANLTSVTIGGSLIGGQASLNSGALLAAGDVTTLTITGNIRGGSATGTKSLQRSGYVQAIRIGTMIIGGSIIAGTDTTTGSFDRNGAVSVTNDIGVATIKGSLIGNSTNKVLITARGQKVPTATADLAIGSLTVNGRVEYAKVLAGYDIFGTARNADAQIGPVTVGLDWIATDLVAGAVSGGDGKFGTIDDAKMPGTNGINGFKDAATLSSKITSVTIGGQAFGTSTSGDQFGIVAQNIGSFKLKGGLTVFPMLAGNGNDSFIVGLFADMTIREIL